MNDLIVEGEYFNCEEWFKKHLQKMFYDKVSSRFCSYFLCKLADEIMSSKTYLSWKVKNVESMLEVNCNE